MKKYVFDWLMLRQKMLGHDLKQCAMIQEFIKSPAAKPAVVRLTYYVSTKQPRANIAYLLTSKVHTDPQSDLLHKTVIDLSLPDSIEVFKQSGKALHPFEVQAKSLVDFLQRGYHVRFEEIVLDFLKSSDGTVWFCGCKGFRLDEATVPEPIYMTETFSPFRQGKKEGWTGEAMKKKEEEKGERLIGSFVTCRLCRVQYANHELPHLVSVKMLFLFRFHAMQRIHLPIETSHLKVTSQDLLSQSVRICACCFMVVTAEHSLQIAETQLALALNIPVKEEDITAKHEPSDQLQFLPKVLRQYRLLFSFERVEVGREPIARGKLYLHFQLMKASAVFPLERLDEIGETRSYPIYNLRLVYVFSAQSKPLNSFLRKAEVRVSISSSPVPDLGHLYASGCSPLLQTFPVTTQLGTALYTKQHLSLFNLASTQRYPLSIGIGFSCDHLFDPELLRVELTKTMDAYLPDDHYYNTDPLPEDWLTAFGEERREEDSFGQEVNFEDAYGPLINTGDLDRMQDITSPYPAPLSNKLVVSRPKPRKSRSVSMLSSKAAPTPPTLSSPLVSDVTRLDPATDSQVVDVVSLVDGFLSQKPVENLPLSCEKIRVLPVRKCCENEQSPYGTKRTWSRLRTHSVSTRLCSGKSSTRSMSPSDVKKALSRHFKEVAKREFL